MRPLHTPRPLVLSLVILLSFGLLGAWSPAAAPAQLSASRPSGKLTPRLAALSTPAVQQLAADDLARQLSLPASGGGSLLRSGDELLVNVRVANTNSATVKALEGVGAHVVTIASNYAIVAVSIKPSALAALAALPAVISVVEELRPFSSAATSAPSPYRASSVVAAACTGAATSEGDIQLRAALARSSMGVNGTGVMVGILSDTFDRAAGATTHATGDVASGDLPGPGNPCGFTTPVNVLEEQGFGGNDEGRGMAQIVHDLAPGAKLLFATAADGMYNYASNIRALKQAGARIIVDDYFYFQEPFFQSGPLSNAVDEVTAAGVSYFGSAGNANVILGGKNVASWETPAFRPTSCPAGLPSYVQQCEDFNSTAAADNGYAITVPSDGGFTLDMQWSEPWFGVDDDLDIYVLDEAGVLVASSEQTNGATGTPVEFLSVHNSTAASKTYRVVINRYLGAGTPRLKFVILNADISAVEYPVSFGGDIVGPTIFGHHGAFNTISVAAVYYGDANLVESYSSSGPVTLYWGPASNTTPAPPLASPQVIAKPDLAATDGVATTFFGQQESGIWRFYGTSAAAPHAAAVAALMLQGFPTLTPTQVKAALKSRARPVGSSPATFIGSGLVDAFGSVASVVPAISISNATTTEGQAGSKTLTFTVTLSKASPATVAVRFATENGSALAGSDYVQRSGSVTFAPGQTTRPIVITINSDATLEPNETFNVRIKLPIRGRISDALGQGTITNDD